MTLVLGWGGTGERTRGGAPLVGEVLERLEPDVGQPELVEATEQVIPSRHLARSTRVAVADRGHVVERAAQPGRVEVE